MDQALTGGEVISGRLKGLGVETVFCLAGTAHTYLLKALHADGVAIVPSRHETATVCAADGYARIAGRVGVALVKDEQGIANAVTGIINAQQACSPVVVLVSIGPVSWVEAQSEFSNDPLDLVKPIAKWVRTAPSADRLDEFLIQALRQAVSGRPGVAVLGIHQQFEREAVAAVERLDRPDMALVAAPAAAPEAVARAAQLLAEARRPLIIAGSGAAMAGAGEALRRFSDAYRIPVFGHALGRGLQPEDQQLGYSWALAQPAAREADVVLWLGSRMHQRFGFGLAPRFAPDAAFIQVDLCAEELGRNRAVNVPILADARGAMEALHTAMVERGAPPSDPAWVNQALEPRRARIAELGRDGSGPIHPVAIARQMAEALPRDIIYVGDGADVQNFMGTVLEIRSERSFLDLYPFGSMGVGTPLALGAAAGERDLARWTGRPERPVYLVTGDGAFGFYCSEFNSAHLAGLKIICIISNDGAWGTEKHGQVKALGTSFNCELGQADYHLVGEAYGAAGELVETVDAFAPALQRAMQREQSSVLNVHTDPAAGMDRKTDPRLVTIAFEDLVSSQRTHAAPAVR